MARRRDQAFAGRDLAGEFGDLFVLTDGFRQVFDTDEVYPSPDLAHTAWQRARAVSWAHEYREDVWPPYAAEVYDGITSRARACAPMWPLLRWRRDEVAQAVAADRSSVGRFRSADRAGAVSVAPWLDEYLSALGRFGEIAASDLDIETAAVAWRAAESRGIGADHGTA